MAADNCQSQRRICRMLLILAGHELHGLRNTDLAKALSTSPATITRDLQVLSDEGLAEKVPDVPNHWRLAPKIAQIGLAHLQAMEDARRKFEEINQRYSRLPK